MDTAHIFMGWWATHWNYCDVVCRSARPRPTSLPPTTPCQAYWSFAYMGRADQAGMARRPPCWRARHPAFGTTVTTVPCQWHCCPRDCSPTSTRNTVHDFGDHLWLHDPFFGAKHAVGAYYARTYLLGALYPQFWKDTAMSGGWKYSILPSLAWDAPTSAWNPMARQRRSRNCACIHPAAIRDGRNCVPPD